MIEKCFLVQNMDECRNAMLHQILNDHYLGTFSKTEKRLINSLGRINSIGSKYSVRCSLSRNHLRKETAFEFGYLAAQTQGFGALGFQCIRRVFVFPVVFLCFPMVFSCFPACFRCFVWALCCSSEVGVANFFEAEVVRVGGGFSAELFRVGGASSAEVFGGCSLLDDKCYCGKFLAVSCCFHFAAGVF